MADVSITLDLQAKQLYEDLQRVQSNFAGFASRVTSEGEKAATGFSGGFRSGLSGLRGALSGTLGALGVGVGIGAVVGELKQVIDKAHEIHHEAERFGLDAEQLQLIGNAARQEGIDLSTTARAMNLLTINSAAASEGTGKQADALARLGISFQEFYSANPAEKFLLLSEAYKNSSKDAQAYADAATLIGKRNTELIPVLELGRKAIEDESKAMGILSSDSAKRLDESYKVIAQHQNQLVTGIGNVIASVDRAGDAYDNFQVKVANAMRAALGIGTLPVPGEATPFVPGGGAFGGHGAGSSFEEPTAAPTSTGPTINSFDIYAASLKAGVSPEEALAATKYAQAQGFTDTTGINLRQAAEFQRQTEAQAAINQSISEAAGIEGPIPGSAAESAENIRAGELESQFQQDLSGQEIGISNWEAGQTLLEQIRDNTANSGANL